MKFRRVILLPMAVMALPCCALFRTASPDSTQTLAVTPATEVHTAVRPAPAAVTAPRVSRDVSEVAPRRALRWHRRDRLAVGPMRAGETDLALEVLRRFLARATPTVLDLSRVDGVQAEVTLSHNDANARLHGPWTAAVWAGRWGDASHVLLSEPVMVESVGANHLARGSFRVLELPGAEVVWAGVFVREGDTRETAIARLCDGLVNALHGELAETETRSTDGVGGDAAAQTHGVTQGREAGRHRRRNSAVRHRTRR